MNKQRKKFGISEIFVLLLVGFIVVGVILFLVKDKVKYEELTYTQLLERLEEKSVKEIAFSGVKGEGNTNVLFVEGTYTEEYQNNFAYNRFTIYVQEADYETIVLYARASEVEIVGTKVLSSFNWMNIIWIGLLIFSVITQQ